MLSKNKHEFWFDAKHEAIELSGIFGWAWIINAENNAGFRVATAELHEEGPQTFLAEFKDGVEQ